MYNQSRDFGYVIEADKDIVRVVNENNAIQVVRQIEIEKKIVIDKKTMGRDSMGNSISMNDSIKVTRKNSRFADQKGVIKAIYKDCLFLWDNSFL